MHKSVRNGFMSPLNPILGETLTMHSESGVTFYAEQTSHHPPITNYLIEGPADCPFRMYGHTEIKVQFRNGGTTIVSSQPGKLTLELPDGSKYELQNKEVHVEGLMNKHKNLHFVGELEVRDMTNMMLARTAFDFNKSKRKTGMMARFVTGTDKKNKDGVYENRRDLIKMEII